MFIPYRYTFIWQVTKKSVKAPRTHVHEGFFSFLLSKHGAQWEEKYHNATPPLKSLLNFSKLLPNFFLTKVNIFWILKFEVYEFSFFLTSGKQNIQAPWTSCFSSTFYSV